ncbi:MAG: hypothetical protein GX030_01405 [Firmicutes bacterium]|nr:hypothetical protein [Bacillota bacterium]
MKQMELQGKVTHSIFEPHMQNHEGLLRQITQLLESDERIAAAWLLGSLGSGEGDHLSDIDIFVVVFDDHFDAVADFKGSSISTDSMLVKQSVPEVAPPGGAFFHMVYDSSTGPILLDCNLQKCSGAIIPSQVRVLFDHVNLPRSEKPLTWDLQPGPKLTELESYQRDWNMCVYSIPHALKYYVRDPWLEGIPDTHRIERLCFWLGVDSPSFTLEAFGRPAVKVKYIRDLVNCLDSLVPHARARGVDVSEEAIPSIRRFLELSGAFVDGK